jgi:polyhydroxyalkanoate synthesis regulator phasin
MTVSAIAGGLVAIFVVLVQQLFLRRKTQADVHATEADAAKTVAEAARLLLEPQMVRIAALEAGAIEAAAKLAVSKLAEDLCARQLVDLKMNDVATKHEMAELRLQLAELRRQVESLQLQNDQLRAQLAAQVAPITSPHVVTTVTTVDAPGEPPAA